MTAPTKLTGRESLAVAGLMVVLIVATLAIIRNDSLWVLVVVAACAGLVAHLAVRAARRFQRPPGMRG